LRRLRYDLVGRLWRLRRLLGVALLKCFTGRPLAGFGGAAAVVAMLEEQHTDLVLLLGRVVGFDSAMSRLVALRTWVRVEKHWRAY